MSGSEPFYTAAGKWYKKANGQVVPSAGSICTAITKESFDFVGIETLERAVQQGEGAHDVACQYSLQVLGHVSEVSLPPMPAGHPDTRENWDKAMAHALDQVKMLFEEYEVEPIAVEEPSVCTLYGFGGQPDIKLRMSWKKKRYIAVWDYKRVAALSLSHLLKIECYRMLDGYQDCKLGFIAWLKKGDDAELKQVLPNSQGHVAICSMANVMNYQISQRVIKP